MLVISLLGAQVLQASLTNQLFDKLLEHVTPSNEGGNGLVLLLRFLRQHDAPHRGSMIRKAVFHNI